ncbi:uncharacterized protein KIAA0825 homolog isoform X1 [Scleropages formosus]|uniref:uncharacterized protein KIAA0825 homolog isoform X1 n=1 Tax=Scleropages formosus TaxID=113540 RepID=UPI0010FAA6E1|nr:uncharacterized protein KIAA0825 homolog isoform X1 [Scleropages formosus]XP_018614747.2 uncharacterized protein KIAA0825 homolog isoform X1 [Scleropages formosus]
MEWQPHLFQDHVFVDCVSSGLPRELDVQQLLRDTEEKLKLNGCCIEQRLRELQAKLGDSCNGDRASPGSTDSLQWFSSRNLGLLKPISTAHQDLLDFLRALQQYLRTGEDGREDVALRLLLDISCQCGVAFPSPAPLTSLQPALPSFPLHGVHEEMALDVQEAWEDVRLLLRRHILDGLQGVAGGRGDGEGRVDDAQTTRRIRGLQQLLFLYPETEVLSRYQGLRAKAVEDLIQGTQAPSSGETGFQRLAHGFQSAAAALLGMLREDVLALSAVVDLSTVVAFANQAYLGTISQELLSLVEKLCENAMKDNSAHSSKSGRSSAKIKAAVGAQDQQRRVRSFCLTSHQLHCLARLTVTLQELEEQVEELLTVFTFHGGRGESPCGVKGILKKSREAAETTTGEGSRCSADLFLQHIPEQPVVLEFDWRNALRDLASPMAHCVKVVLEDVCSKSLQQEEATHATHNVLLVGDVPPKEGTAPSCQENETPRKITKFCEVIMGEVDRLFPLAMACREDTLLEVRSSFVEVCSHVTLALLHRLQERAGEVPSTASLKNLPVLLATTVHLHQRLGQIRTHLRNGGRVPLSLLPVQKCQDLTEALYDHLVGYSVNVCAVSILQDPEAHHWGDAKPFYEGERCSFSIQMWYYFLRGLRSDLWLVFPPVLAQKILSQVLSQTLEILVQRYSHACPTYRRSQQIRVDITSILLCVEQMMWSLCDSPEALLQPDWTTCPWVSSIHSLCNQLLGVLVITMAPLPLLCSVFQGNAGDGSSSEEQSAKWLTVINPTLFPQQSLQLLTADESTAHRLLKLTTSQPSCNHKLVLLTIMHDDCALLRLLLSNSYFCVDVDSDGSGRHTDGDAFMEAVFSVLTTLNNIPRALALVLETYFDKRHLWDHLYSMTDVGQTEPAVLKCLRAVVAKPIARMLNHIIDMVQAHAPQDEPGSLPPRQDPPDSVLFKVPKEWNYTPCDTKAAESRNQVKLVMQAMSFLFANLPSAVASLPLPVRFLFHVGEKRLSQHARQLKPTGLLQWALLSWLCQSLEEKHRGSETLVLLSECLQASMGQQRGVPKPAVHKVLQGLEESRPKWTATQLQKGRKLCAEGAFKPAEGGVAPERGSAPELTEQKIRLMLLEVCHKPGGAEYLRQIYHIIQLNEDLLSLWLSTPSDAQADLPQRTVNLNLEESECRRQQTTFNPLTQFNHVGDRTFSQSAISEWNWDWARLLPSYLGMSQVTFRALLANRWNSTHMLIFQLLPLTHSMAFHSPRERILNEALRRGEPPGSRAEHPGGKGSRLLSRSPRSVCLALAPPLPMPRS